MPDAITECEFAALMAGLGPFEPAPFLAVAVSGGADSMALAVLASAWTKGAVLGLIVDHGLRPESASEATLTAQRLGACRITSRILTLRGLAPGSGLAARARAARYHAVLDACADAGALHLLLGHHAGDQAETAMIRVLSGSGAAGLAGMAALLETERVRLLRPLLTTPPARLRATLRARGIDWVEDPSNRNPAALRARLRMARPDPDATAALVAAMGVAGRARAERNARTARVLAQRAAIHPEGFAVLSPGPIPPAALASLLRMIAGAAFGPPDAAIVALAAAPRPATLGGVRLLPAGRLGPGLLLVREPSAMAPPVPALPGALWDGRFRLTSGAKPPLDATLGALGDDAAPLRHLTHWPDAVLRTLPAIRRAGVLACVPAFGYAPDPACASLRARAAPLHPAASAPFVDMRALGMQSVEGRPISTGRPNAAWEHPG